ncbi:MAG: cell division protein ZapA [Gammaproteobacteria bacterium]
MSLNKETIQIQLLGKPYKMACPSNEAPQLKEAAQYLEQKVKALQKMHTTAAPERIAIMVALDLAHELLTQRGQSLDYRDSMEAKVRSLTATLEGALEPI